MSNRGKWLLGGGVAVGLLALASAFVVPALAQGPGPGSGPPGPGAGLQVVVESVTALLGATPDELRAERQAGSSLVDVAAARGVDQATLVKTIGDALRGQLAVQVASGRVPAALAERLDAHLDQGVTAIVTRSGPPLMPGGGPAFRLGQTPGAGPDGRPGRGPGGHHGRGFDALREDGRSVANLLGMTPDELRAERRAGRSLADIAAGRGVDQGALVQTLTAREQTRLADAVAKGRLTQEQADARQQRAQQFATQMATQSGPPDWMGRGPRPDGGPRQGPPGRDRGNRPGAPPADATPPQ